MYLVQIFEMFWLSVVIEKSFQAIGPGISIMVIVLCP